MPSKYGFKADELDELLQPQNTTVEEFPIGTTLRFKKIAKKDGYVQHVGRDLMYKKLYTNTWGWWFDCGYRNDNIIEGEMPDQRIVELIARTDLRDVTPDPVLAPSQQSKAQRIVNHLTKNKKRQEDSMQDALRWLESGGYQTGDIIQFTRILSGRRYTYVALRVDKRWYLTGQSSTFSDGGLASKFLSDAVDVTTTREGNVPRKMSADDGSFSISDNGDAHFSSNAYKFYNDGMITHYEARDAMESVRNYNRDKILARAQELLAKRQELEEKISGFQIEALEEALVKVKEDDSIRPTAFNSIKEQIMSDKLVDANKGYSQTVQGTGTETYQTLIENLELLDDETIILSTSERAILEL